MVPGSFLTSVLLQFRSHPTQPAAAPPTLQAVADQVLFCEVQRRPAFEDWIISILGGNYELDELKRAERELERLAALLQEGSNPPPSIIEPFDIEPLVKERDDLLAELQKTKEVVRKLKLIPQPMPDIETVVIQKTSQRDFQELKQQLAQYQEIEKELETAQIYAEQMRARVKDAVLGREKMERKLVEMQDVFDAEVSCLRAVLAKNQSRLENFSVSYQALAQKLETKKAKLAACRKESALTPFFIDFIRRQSPEVQTAFKVEYETHFIPKQLENLRFWL